MSLAPPLFVSSNESLPLQNIGQLAVSMFIIYVTQSIYNEKDHHLQEMINASHTQLTCELLNNPVKNI